jgi:hypothetical protein
VLQNFLPIIRPIVSISCHPLISGIVTLSIELWQNSRKFMPVGVYIWNCRKCWSN